MFPILPFLAIILLQETPPASPAATPAATPAPPDAARVEMLRQRIHGMRMDLLLGGEKVKQAESDATQFYRGKIEVIDKRLDTIAGELAERRAGYRMSLQR